MNPSSSDPARPLLEVRGALASSVIVQRIRPENAEVFMDWQRTISAAAAEFPGYQTTEVYPPSKGLQEWVVVIHFDDSQCMQNWLDSPKRAECIAKLPCEIRDLRVKMLPTGFGSWFAGLTADGGQLPHWKSFLTVLFVLYPTVMLLTLFLAPHTQRFGLAVSMLIGNAASVSFLEWYGMSAVSRLFGPWLRANGKEGRSLSLLGLVLILGALGLMTFLFYLVSSRP